MPGAKSRIAGYYYLSNHPFTHNPPTNIPLNGAILIECKTIRHVVASAAEAETGGLFHNAQTAIMIRNAITELGHKQPPTPIKTDNSTANSFIHANMKQKRSKSWDMRYHWLRDRQTLEQFNFYWARGIYNHADYYTKHHSPQHHHKMRKQYYHLCFVMRTNISDLNSLTHTINNLTSICTKVCYFPTLQGNNIHITVRYHPLMIRYKTISYTWTTTSCPLA